MARTILAGPRVLAGVALAVALAACGTDPATPEAGTSAPSAHETTEDETIGADGTESSDIAEPTDPADETTDAATERASTDEAAEQALPRLAELRAFSGNTYSRATLVFEPDRGDASVEVTESDDSTVSRPSGEPVELEGDRALRAVVSPARAGDLRTLHPETPGIVEVRPLGQVDDRVVLGIGVQGSGDLDPEINRRDGNRVIIAVRHPPQG